ncbi:hypothetical protein ACWKSP_22300 [Micromonosporaceae bacterium Da 78-11]
MIYRFEVHRSNADHECFHRDLPDDDAAINWMGCEIMSAGDRMTAYRSGEAAPFARREFAGDVAVFG